MIAAPPTLPLFFAVGHDGLRLVSSNGVDWRSAQLGSEGEVYRSARFGNHHLVALGSYGGDNIWAASSDGTEWKTARIASDHAKFFCGLGFGNGHFLAVGGDPVSVGHAGPFVQTSLDGIEWSEARNISGGSVLRRVVWGEDRWVGVGDRGRRSSSTDGENWHDVPDTRAIDTLMDVAFGNGRFVGVGLHGLRMSTEDGIRWSAPLRGEEGEHLNSIVWADDRFVAVGVGATYSSPDGLQWERTPNTSAPLTVAFGDRTFIGAHWKGRLFHSTDAITWKQVHRADRHLEAVAAPH